MGLATAFTNQTAKIIKCAKDKTWIWYHKQFYGLKQEIWKDAPYTLNELGPLYTSLSPMIVVHGYLGGCGDLTNHCRQLASHGYVIFALDMHDGSCQYSEKEDGTPVLLNTDNEPLKVYEDAEPMLQVRINNVTDFIDELSEDQQDFCQTRLMFPEGVSLDMSKLIVNGHSFGGMTSIASAIRDDRIKATLSLDPWFMCVSRNDFSKYNLGPSLPMQALWSEKFFQFENGAYDHVKARDGFFEASKQEGNRRIEVIVLMQHGHGNQTDLGALKPCLSKILRGTGKLGTRTETGLMYAIYAQLQLKYLQNIGLGNNLTNMNAVEAAIKERQHQIHHHLIMDEL